MQESKLKADGGTQMLKHTRRCRNNWVITVESRIEQHQEIIVSAVAKRAYQLFEQRGSIHGSDVEDWLAAEKELLLDDFDGNSSQFHLFVECPGDPEVTTVLSMTTRSMVVFRSRGRHVGEMDSGPDVVSIHVLPEEIDPTLADVNPVDGLLHVYIPKRNHRSPGHFVSSSTTEQPGSKCALIDQEK
jgi:hypothetical protein